MFRIHRIAAVCIAALAVTACTGQSDDDLANATDPISTQDIEQAIDADDDEAADTDPATLSGRWFAVDQVDAAGTVLPDEEDVEVWFEEDRLGPNMGVGITACSGGHARFSVAEGSIEPLPDEDGNHHFAAQGPPCDRTDIGDAVVDLFRDELNWALDGDSLLLASGDVTVELTETEPPSDAPSG